MSVSLNHHMHNMDESKFPFKDRSAILYTDFIFSFYCEQCGVSSTSTWPISWD